MSNSGFVAVNTISYLNKYNDACEIAIKMRNLAPSFNFIFDYEFCFDEIDDKKVIYGELLLKPILKDSQDWLTTLNATILGFEEITENEIQIVSLDESKFQTTIKQISQANEKINNLADNRTKRKHTNHRKDPKTNTSVSKQDHRNLLDNYKNLDNESIKKLLAPQRHNFETLIENYAFDFNLGASIRNHNIFLGSNLVRSGRNSFNPRGAVGTNHYEPLEHAKTSLEAIKKFKSQGKTVIAIDNIPGAVPLESINIDENCAFVFGQESIGISNAAINAADIVAYPATVGNGHDLAVAQSSAIVMYEYLRQNKRGLEPKNPVKVQQSKLHNDRFPEEIFGLENSDRKNIIDYYQYWNSELFKQHLRQEADNDISVLLDNVDYNINLSYITRAVAHYNINELYTNNQEFINGLPTNNKVKTADNKIEIIKAKKEAGYKIVALDYLPGSKTLWDYKFDDKSLLLFGSEHEGIHSDQLALSDDVVHIPQFGSARSLNVGNSVSVVLHEVVSQLRK